MHTTYDTWKATEPDYGDERPEEGEDEIKIITRYNPKPIPDRRFDWSAVTDNYDLGSPIGYGRTEAEAIADLRLEIGED